jgi:ferric iron reductase protein FhuF
MIAALAQIFTGRLAEIGEALVLADDPRPHIPGSALCDENELKQFLDRFGANYAQPDALAVATQWSKWHFSVLLTPVMAANIAADWQLPVAIDEIGVVLSPDSRMLAVRLAHEGERRRFAQGHERFVAISDDHLAPLIKALSKASGLPAKVLWSNAGNVIETVVAQCAALLGESHDGVRQAQAFLAARSWPDGRRNELFAPISYVGEERQRKRRICCLRYRIETLPLCKSCPLDSIPKKARHPKTEAQTVE